MPLAFGGPERIAEGEPRDPEWEALSAWRWFRLSGSTPDAGADEAVLARVLEFASASNRVCPKPVSWSRLYAMLLAGSGDRSRIPPPPPIHGTEWAITSSAMKKRWLRDHLEWAGRARMLEVAASFLRELPESDWFRD